MDGTRLANACEEKTAVGYPANRLSLSVTTAPRLKPGLAVYPV